MAGVTATVGTAAGRDYADLVDAHADIGNIASVGDDLVIQVYADGTISHASLTWSDTTLTSTGTLYISGVPNKFGYLPVLEFNDAFNHLNFASADPPGLVVLENLKLKGFQSFTSGTNGIIRHGDSNTTIIRNLEIHGADSASGTPAMRSIRLDGGNCTVVNCIIHTGNATGGGFNTGIHNNNAGTNAVLNCTIDNFLSVGIAMSFGETLTVKNTVAIRCDSASNAFTGTSNSASDNNASDSTVAPGTNSIDNITPADEFVSLTTPDYRLKKTSQLIRAGLTTGDRSVDLFGHNAAVGITPNIGADQVTMLGEQMTHCQLA